MQGSELASAAGVALQEAHYGRVALGPSDELLQGELSWKARGRVSSGWGCPPHPQPSRGSSVAEMARLSGDLPPALRLTAYPADVRRPGPALVFRGRGSPQRGPPLPESPPWAGMAAVALTGPLPLLRCQL